MSGTPQKMVNSHLKILHREVEKQCGGNVKMAIIGKNPLKNEAEEKGARNALRLDRKRVG